MSFRYENYGTADLLLTEGTTYKVDTTKSKFGSAFVQTQSAKCFDIPATAELWVKFDLYVENSNSRKWYIENLNSSDKKSGIYKPSGSRFYIEEASSSKVTIRNVLEAYQLQTFLLHMSANSSDGVIEVWVDGTKAGTYTGNINSGNAFETFYLSADSDNGEVLFSNVIISDEEIGLDEDATAPDDSIDVEVVADTAISIVQKAEISGDTERKISTIATTAADTQRNLSNEAETFADTARLVAKDIEIVADTTRIVDKNVVAISADTLRNVEKSIELKASTVRNVDSSTEISADTARTVSMGFEIVADTKRIVSKSVEIAADTEREVSESVEINADTLRQVKQTAEFTVEIACDTQRQIEIPVEVAADTKVDIEKGVNIKCDTARSLPMWLLSAPLYKRGLKSLKIELQQLSTTDSIEYSLASNDPADFATIGDAVNGDYYNYTFRYNVVETDQRGIVQTCQCAVDIDEILYTSVNYDIKGSDLLTEYKYAREHISAIASKISKNLVYLAKDFKTTMALEQQNITYSSLISELFGWTSRIPHKMINCYFRADTLYVIQRGYETDIVDITDAKHTLPTINRTLERITWSSEADSKTTVTRKVGGLSFEHWNWVDFVTKPDEGGFADVTVEYTGDTISKKTVTTQDGTKVETEYEYEEKGGTKFLKFENETTTDSDGNTSTLKTVHTSLGQGQRLSTVYKDGEYVTSSIGNTGGDDSATPYINLQVLRKQIIEAQEENQNLTIEGNPLIDPSFPLADDEELEAVTAELKWLNRKIRETITMDLEKFEHILDFSDLILFEGNYYHLQSNTILKDERTENRQSISIVRWY